MPMVRRALFCRRCNEAFADVKLRYNSTWNRCHKSTVPNEPSPRKTTDNNEWRVNETNLCLLLQPSVEWNRKLKTLTYRNLWRIHHVVLKIEEKHLGFVYIPHVKVVSEKFRSIRNQGIRAIFRTKHTLTSSFMKTGLENDPQQPV
jgi:hypothetical protein